MLGRLFLYAWEPWVNYCKANLNQASCYSFPFHFPSFLPHSYFSVRRFFCRSELLYFRLVEWKWGKSSYRKNNFLIVPWIKKIVSEQKIISKEKIVIRPCVMIWLPITRATLNICVVMAPCDAPWFPNLSCYVNLFFYCVLLFEMRYILNFALINLLNWCWAGYSFLILVIMDAR